MAEAKAKLLAGKRPRRPKTASPPGGGDVAEAAGGTRSTRRPWSPICRSFGRCRNWPRPAENSGTWAWIQVVRGRPRREDQAALQGQERPQRATATALRIFWSRFATPAARRADPALQRSRRDEPGPALGDDHGPQAPPAPEGSPSRTPADTGAGLHDADGRQGRAAPRLHRAPRQGSQEPRHPGRIMSKPNSRTHPSPSATSFRATWARR